MSAHGHNHSATPSTKRRLTAALALAAAYLVAEVIGGLWSGSLALLADAGHMLTDVGGLGLALLALRFSETPATPERTYGYYRGEILAALANAVVLVLISLYVLYEAYQRFQAPPEVASGTVLIVASIGLVVNVAGILLLRSGARDSLNVKGAYFEVLSDLLSSVAVIAAAGVMWLTGWYYADPIVSAAIGLFILPRTWRLIGEAVGILLEGTPSDVNMTALRGALARLPGVKDVHDLHVWTLTSGYNAMSAHLLMEDERLLRTIIDGARAVAGEHSIRHVTVQVEPEGCERNEFHL
jgi:cobalt-zinc-cadmium efflux system protein